MIAIANRSIRLPHRYGAFRDPLISLSRWTAPTWSVETGKLMNLPTLGSELLSNNAFESGVTSWSLIGSPTPTSDSQFALGSLVVSLDGGNTLSPMQKVANSSVWRVWASGSAIYVATWGGGLSISTDGGNTFINKTTADGLGSNLTYAVWVDGSNVYLATASGLAISTNGGSTFINKTTANGLGDNIVYGVYAGGGTIYAATKVGLSISTDGGTSFVNKTTANGLGSNIVYWVTVYNGIIYAGTTGGLSISTDGGNSFINKTTANGLGANTILQVFVDSNGIIYAATTGGLSISTDGGNSFVNKKIAHGLGSNTIYGVYAVENTVYAATLGGLSISTNSGASFINKTTAHGLGNSNVRGVWVDGNALYAVTWGSGTYSLKLVTDGDGNDGIYQYPAITEGSWCFFDLYGYTTDQPLTLEAVTDGGAAVLASKTVSSYWGRLAATGRAVGTTSGVRGSIAAAGAMGYFDYASLRQITLSTMFCVRRCILPAFRLTSPLTSVLVPGTQMGIVLCQDDPANPQNHIKAYCDGNGNVKIEKRVNGVVTTLATVAAAWAANKKFSAIRSALDTFEIYYGATDFETLIGVVVVGDESIISNQYYGLLSTYSGNWFNSSGGNSFAMLPYGT